MVNSELTTVELVLKELRRQGKRITGQRKVILEIILNQKWENCKDIYYEALKRDPSIGIATVYRMLDTLEETSILEKQCSYHLNEELIEECRLREEAS